MADENTTPLSQQEYTALGKAIYDMIAACPDIPKAITIDYQDLRGPQHIGVGTDAGGRYTRQDVTGGFEARLPFSYVYQVKATNNAQMLAAEELLNKIADYLENADYPPLSDGRSILRITMNSITYKIAADEDGSIRFRRSGVLEYEKE